MAFTIVARVLGARGGKWIAGLITSIFGLASITVIGFVVLGAAQDEKKTYSSINIINNLDCISTGCDHLWHSVCEGYYVRCRNQRRLYNQ